MTLARIRFTQSRVTRPCVALPSGSFPDVNTNVIKVAAGPDSKPNSPYPGSSVAASKKDLNESVSPNSLVIRGQKVLGSDNQELIVFDPRDQAYQVTYVDKNTLAMQKY